MYTRRIQLVFTGYIQSLQFQLRQIVLGYLHIVARHVVALEVGHTYKRFLVVHTLINQFCCRMLMYGIVHLVLHSSEEELGRLRTWIVVSRCGIDDCNGQSPFALVACPLDELTSISCELHFRPVLRLHKYLSDVG